MRYRTLTLALFFAFGLGACSDPDPIGPRSSDPLPLWDVIGLDEDQIVPNQHIVVLQHDIGVADVDSEVRRLIGLMDQVAPGSIGLRTFRNSIKGFSVEVPDDGVLEAILADGSVRYVVPNREIQLMSTPGVQDDPIWGLDRIDQRDLPLDERFRYPGTGTGVAVYVIDTGFRFTHNEFGGRAIHGADFHDIPNDGIDCQSHGTHVAGTIGGATYGVAKEVTLVAVRVGRPCPSSFIGWDQYLEGVDWIAGEKLANPSIPMVVNASLGGETYTPVDEAAEALVALGITFVVSAGNNNGANACNVSPARATGVITVGASNIEDARAGFSNRGPCVDLFAPGVEILSAGIASDVEATNKQGTSMAAPHVAGAAALFLEQNPDATPAEVRAWLVGNATSDRLSNVGEGSPNLLLFVPAMIGTLAIEIDILPGSEVNPVNLSSQGSLPVAVLASETFDPANLMLATVRLGDSIGSDTGIQMRPNGTFMAGWEDVNGDGRPDLVLHLSVPALVANGDLTPGTARLILTGSTTDGADVRGEDNVLTVP